MFGLLKGLYQTIFGALQMLAGDWLPGLLARLVFSSVLLVYFINSAMTKVGSGFPGMFIPQSGAYAQMFPPIAEAASYDTSQIALVPWKLLAFAGTWSEFLLPILILVGLLTRLAALGMSVFILVMTYVDIHYHGIGDKAVGLVFDRFHDSIVSDQRLLWLFPLVYLVLKGPGFISLDGLLGRWAKGR